MKNLLLIVNPVSGKMKAKSELLTVVTNLQNNGYFVTVKLTERRGHAVEFAKNAAKDGFDAVACFGGDGTLNETICGLMSSDVKLPLGYIPAGSTNDFAKSMKLSNNPAIAAKVVATGEENSVDVGFFNNERYFTYVACFGALAAASYGVSQGAKNILGHFAYVLGGIKEITNIRGYNVTIELDDRTVSGEYIFVSATNTTSIAGIVKLKEELVNMSDGVFEIALVKKPHNIVELNKIVTSILTSSFDNGQIEFYKSSKMKVIYDGKLDWSLDGEHAESEGNVIIQNLNHGISFLR